MAIVDTAGDWKRVSYDLLEDVSVQQVDADAGPLTTDTVMECVPALKSEVRDSPTGVRGGEVSGRSCRFEIAVSDVSFAIDERHRITAADGTVWVVGSVRTDASGELYTLETTEAREDE